MREPFVTIRDGEPRGACVVLEVDTGRGVVGSNVVPVILDKRNALAFAAALLNFAAGYERSSRDGGAVRPVPTDG